MSKSRMAEVAKLLGVELGESFKVTDDDSGKYHDYYRLTYRLTKEKGIEVSDDNADWEAATAETKAEVLVLKWLLIGAARIVKLPWKPKKGELFYVPALETDSLGRCIRWLGTETDKNLYDRGLVFKTRAEAAKLAQRMLAVAKEAREDG